jgi:hypothetical protein
VAQPATPVAIEIETSRDIEAVGRLFVIGLTESLSNCLPRRGHAIRPFGEPACLLPNKSEPLAGARRLTE